MTGLVGIRSESRIPSRPPENKAKPLAQRTSPAAAPCPCVPASSLTAQRAPWGAGGAADHSRNSPVPLPADKSRARRRRRPRSKRLEHPLTPFLRPGSGGTRPAGPARSQLPLCHPDAVALRVSPSAGSGTHVGRPRWRGTKSCRGTLCPCDGGRQSRGLAPAPCALPVPPPRPCWGKDKVTGPPSPPLGPWGDPTPSWGGPESPMNTHGLCPAATPAGCRVTISLSQG